MGLGYQIVAFYKRKPRGQLSYNNCKLVSRQMSIGYGNLVPGVADFVFYEFLVELFVLSLPFPGFFTLVAFPRGVTISKRCVICGYFRFISLF